MTRQDPRDVIVRRKPPASPVGERWAIVVGISKYRHASLDLVYADRDAHEFHAFIQSPEGGGFKRENVVCLVNETATTENVTRALRTFLKKPDRDDLVVIYFACHGSSDPDRPDNVYLLTHDVDPSDIAGTAVPMREIDLSLRENLRAEKVVIVADTCHSAAIGGGPGLRRSASGAGAVNAYLRAVSETRSGVALLTSAEANEVSFEGAQWGGGHGVFTHYLLEGMRGAADISPSNGIVTVGELFEYVRENVKKATDHRQHPAIGTTQFDRGLPMAIPGLNAATSEHATADAELSAADAGGSPGSPVVANGVGMPLPRKRSARSVLIVAAALILVIALGSLSYRQWPRARRPATVEVLEFLSVGKAWKGSETLSLRQLHLTLARSLSDSGWRTLTREALEARAVEEGLGDSGALDTSRASRDRRVGFGHTVGGIYELVSPDTIDVETHVVDIASGRVIDSRMVRTTTGKLQQSVLGLAGDVFHGTPLKSQGDSMPGPPGRLAAVSDYVNGLLWLRRNRVADARELFRRAVKEDSTYIPATDARRVLELFTRDPRPVVAIGTFKDADPSTHPDSGYAGLGKGLSEMMLGSLNSDARAMIVDRERLPALLAEATTGGVTDRKKIIRAQYLVSGSFRVLEPSLDLDVQLSDLATGMLLERFTSRMTFDSLFSAIDALAARSAAALSVLPPVATPEALDSLQRFRRRIGLPERVTIVRR
jgi:curli biogenesis system outer membrane secretion channel CsgG